MIPQEMPELARAKRADLQREAAHRQLIQEARRGSSKPGRVTLRRRLGEGLASLGTRLHIPRHPSPRRGGWPPATRGTGAA